MKFAWPANDNAPPFGSGTRFWLAASATFCGVTLLALVAFLL